MQTITPTQPNASSRWTDIVVAMLLGSLVFGLVQVGRHWEAPLQQAVVIDLRLRALPGYACLSLLRGFVAYGLSFLFTMFYGYTAAHKPRAERIMVPLLDILQSIPVLGFLPGAVLALVALFPHTNVGLELACILMIFTGQVWNMTFSFYQSLRAIPREFSEVAALYQFGWKQKFTRLELPSSALGLSWNSMMAMAGGWFFLMICEAFKLGDRDFRVPGLGSYMSVAIADNNKTAIVAGIFTMIAMIVIVDTLVWRPVLVWVQKFRLGETASSDVQKSHILDWIQGSRLLNITLPSLIRPLWDRVTVRFHRSSASAETPKKPAHRLAVGGLLGWVVFIAFLGSLIPGVLGLFHLLRQLPLSQWLLILKGTLFTLLRVTGAIVLSSLWTIPVGVWIGKSRARTKRLQPVIQVAASFPAPMLYPMVLIALHSLNIHLGVGSAVLMLVGVQWYILFNVIAGASQVAPEFKEVASVYHFNSWQRWKLVWWPAIFPYLTTGWITAAGGAWNASIVAEYVSVGPNTYTATGLGSLISVAASQGHFEILAAGVLTMAIVVVLINRLVWKPLYRFSETRYAI